MPSNQSFKPSRILNIREACRILLVTALFTLLVQPVYASEENGFDMQVYDSFAITDKGTVVYGLIKTGAVSIGDAICVPLTGGETVTRAVTGIERFRKLLERAEAGQTAGLFVDDLDPKLVAKGEKVNGDCELPPTE